MSLERRGGRVYYYESRRVGRAVVRHYWGTGEVAVAMAHLDAARRDARRLDRLTGASLEAVHACRVRRVREWLERADGTVADALRAAGWHQHHRGEWRRKRGATMGELATTTPYRWHGPELARVAGALDPAVADKAGKGDYSVTAAVDQFLARPAAAVLWGDMGRRVLQRWVKRYAGTCVTTERAVLLHAADLRDRLAGQTPDALTGLLAERVVLGWVAACYFENVYAAQADNLSLVVHKFHAARIEAANRTLMSACRALAKVRRRKLPDVLAVVQVNTLPGKQAE